MSGGDDVKAGVEAVRSGLHLDAEGHSRWCVFRGRLKWFCNEAETYSYKRLPNGLVTDDILKQNDHLMDDWRYLACGKLRWVRPPKGTGHANYTAAILKRKREKAKAESGWGGSVKLG